MRTDVHQHIWSEPFVDALRVRSGLPFVRREQGLDVLYLCGERPYVLNLAAELPGSRASLLGSDGVERALVCLSSPLGIEWLEGDAAAELLDAFHAGALALGESFGVWGAVSLADPDPDDVDRALARGCVGVSVPAGALAGAHGLERVRVLLERLQERDAPLFVHPGPGPERAALAPARLDDPLWWPAMTDYVAGMQAAWLTFATLGRPALGRLRVVFAMLAGLAPLHAERLRARGGHLASTRDPGLFYDTSSYGPDAIEAMGTAVGPGQILYGSDRPVLEPGIHEQSAVLDWERVEAATRTALGARAVAVAR